ncbi:hypothetical protein FKW77_006168 [Venturia effusa]|uniref:FAS1 domain-containing protein n=1 Tax=Venturia effusa TaxID=50376 RepID=A0A517L1F3_9PEZI|nr:hypothetical protein FKW77_006168 [Venturia effusa]
MIRLLSNKLFVTVTLFLRLTNAQVSPAAPTTPLNPTSPTPDPTQSSILSSFFASLTAQPAYTSIAAVIATALPDSIVASIEAAATATTGEGNGPGGFLFATGTQNVLTTQGWFTALPSDVKSYVSSVVAEEIVLTTGKAKKSQASRSAVDMEWVWAVGGFLLFVGLVIWL